MMPVTKQTPRLTWLCALGVALALGGCGEMSAPSPRGSAPPAAENALTTPPVADGVELRDRVFWLEVTRNLNLGITAEALAFEAPIPRDVARLRVGDVLVSDIGDGFWRSIVRIERTEGRLVLETRDAQLSEVVENGTFRFMSASADEETAYEGTDDDYARRASPLRPYRRLPRHIRPIFVQTEEALDSLDLSTDLAAESGADVSTTNLDVEATRGGVSFQPAIRLYFEVAGGQIYRERFRVSGWADVDADWTVTSRGFGSLNEGRRLAGVAGPGNQLEFRLVGRRFTIDPDLRLAYEVSSTGQGSADFGIDGEGYVLAGYDCFAFGSCEALEPETGTTPFAAIEEHQLGSGAPNISFKVALLNGVSLKSQGVETATATPLSLRFEAHANVSPPFCPFEATGKATGTASREDDRFRSYFYDLFDVDEIFTGQGGCGVTRPPVDENSQSPCLADFDCPDGQMCMTGKNRCIEEAPFGVTLEWAQSIDLDLRVETVSGEVLSSTTPTISNGKLIEMSAGGTDCEGCIGECTGGVAVDCANESPESGTCPSMCDYNATTDGTCSGTRYVNCASLSDTQCILSRGCVLHPVSLLNLECIGVYVDTCEGLTESTCENTFDCAWSSDTTEWCEGGRVDCSQLDEDTCETYGRCDWELGSGGGGEIPPFIEHASITRASPGDTFRIWVVNNSGTEDDITSYKLHFRTDTGEPFEMRGEFEPAAASQSVFFDFEYQ